MPCVLDASVTLPWFLHDERTPFTDGLFAGLGREEYWVPAVWRLEFPNALLAAERKRRVDRQTRLEALDFATGLALKVDPAPIDMRAVSALAERHGLSAYDAAYLELAMRQGLDLATLDRALADAAAASGIPVLSPSRPGATQPRRRRLQYLVGQK